MFGYVITNFRTGGASIKTERKVKRLIDEFNSLGISLTWYKNDGTLASVNMNGDVILNIKRPDFVIYLDKDKYLARMLEKLGIRLFNRSSFVELCDDKMLTHIEVANHNIPTPKTIAGPLIFDSSTYEDIEDKMLDDIKNKMVFPIIIKGVYGSLGLNMVLVESKDKLKDQYLKMRGQPLLFQEYIKSSYGKSVRVIVIDNKIVGAFERYNPNDYRSNYHEGASSKAIEINDSIMDIINKLLSFLNIEYAGVDLLFGENNMMFCEMNSNAFFEEFEKITGINVALAFAKMVKRKIYEDK